MSSSILLSTQVAQQLPVRTLVLGMIDSDGILQAARLYDLAHACGMTHQQVRLCLRRLVGEGLFTQEGRGQNALFVVTKAGHAVLEPDVEWLRLAYRQDAGLAPWNGIWHLVGFTVSESQRPARDQLREHLHMLGCALLENGLYLSPHAVEPYIRPLAAELEINDAILFLEATRLELKMVTDPQKVATMLWPLERLAEDYRSLVQFWEPLIDQLEHRGTTEDELLPAALLLIQAFEKCMRSDPLLPPELLPSGWPGKTARTLVARARRLRLEHGSLLTRFTLFRSFDRAFESWERVEKGERRPPE